MSLDNIPPKINAETNYPDLTAKTTDAHSVPTPKGVEMTPEARSTANKVSHLEIGAAVFLTIITAGLALISKGIRNIWAAALWDRPYSGTIKGDQIAKVQHAATQAAIITPDNAQQSASAPGSPGHLEPSRKAEIRASVAPASFPRDKVIASRNRESFRQLKLKLDSAMKSGNGDEIKSTYKRLIEIWPEQERRLKQIELGEREGDTEFQKTAVSSLNAARAKLLSDALGGTRERINLEQLQKNIGILFHPETGHTQATVKNAISAEAGKLLKLSKALLDFAVAKLNNKENDANHPLYKALKERIRKDYPGATFPDWAIRTTPSSIQAERKAFQDLAKQMNELPSGSRITPAVQEIFDQALPLLNNIAQHGLDETLANIEKRDKEREALLKSPTTPVSAGVLDQEIAKARGLRVS